MLSVQAANWGMRVFPSLWTSLSGQIARTSERKMGMINFKQSSAEWAKAMIAVNPIIAVLDTTGLGQKDDILRVLFADVSGHVLYDQVIQPQRSSNPNSQFTGISEEQMWASPDLASCWDDIGCFLIGRVLLGYNLQFIVARLRENADHYGLPVIPVIGSCLQIRSQGYFGVSTRLSLSSACERAGLVLPSPMLAYERAQAQGLLLSAMANGQKIADPPTVTADTELDEVDDHPF